MNQDLRAQAQDAVRSLRARKGTLDEDGIDLLLSDALGTGNSNVIMPAVLVAGLDAVEQLGRRIAHLILGVEWPLGLFLKRRRPAIPEQALQEGAVPQRWRAAPGFTAGDADAARQPIAKTRVGTMTAGTGNASVAGQQRIKKQIAAEINLLRCKAIAARR